MWDNLFLKPLEQHDPDPALFNMIGALEVQCQNNVADPALLQNLVQQTGAIAITGLPVRAELISYAENFTGQVELIGQITACFSPHDAAILDITHAVLHLSILVQQVAQLLPVLKKVTIKNVYYGALDMTNRETDGTPVMVLDGLAQIDRWQLAFVQYEQTGNAAVFVPLLRKAGVSQEIIHNLEQAAFLEQTNRMSDARRYIDTFRHQIQQTDDLPAALRLFLPQILERMEWAENNSAEQRRDSARNAIEEHDYLRAAIYTFEASVLCLKAASGITSGHFVEQNEQLQEKVSRDCCSIAHAYNTLRKLRNTIAHGHDSKDIQINRNVRNEAQLKKALLESMEI